MRSIAALAARAGRPAAELADDMLLQDGGSRKLFRPMRNDVHGNRDDVLATMRHRDTAVGLGGGGAHCKIICDASISTRVLSHRVRHRTRGERLPLEWAVQAVMRAPAAAVQLHDCGVIGRGYKADLNVIDLDRLRLRSPELVADLPAGGQRLVQHAEGHGATVESGAVTYRNGASSGALPGRLVRGSQGLQRAPDGGYRRAEARCVRRRHRRLRMPVGISAPDRRDGGRAGARRPVARRTSRRSPRKHRRTSRPARRSASARRDRPG